MELEVELAHLRRLDPWSRLLQWGCEAVFFFWPPVWFASARLDEARELACDELALRHGSLSPVEYARCLVAVFREARSDQTSLAALAMASHPCLLEKRIDMLLKSKPTASKRIVAGLLLTWSALALAGSHTASPIGGLGLLDKALIQNVIHDHFVELKACYESALERAPTTEGTVVVDFTISSQGSVSEAVARFSTLSDEGLEGCITASIAGWHFPKPQGAGLCTSRARSHFRRATTRLTDRGDAGDFEAAERVSARQRRGLEVDRRPLCHSLKRPCSRCS